MELLHQVRNGSEDAAWELVHRHGEAIRRAVRRALNERARSIFDSMDFVQIVWKSFFRGRDKLDQFHRPEELAAFLVGMARNKVHMEMRHRLQCKKNDLRREEPLDQAAGESRTGLTDRQPAPIDVAIAHERWDRMLQGQPAHYRRIIQLRLQGHTHAEIAGMLHLDECTTRRFIKRLFGEIGRT